MLLVEGVGSSRASLTGQLDLSIWVETAEPVRVARDDVRLARGDVTPADYDSWMAEENAHIRRRPAVGPGPLGRCPDRPQLPHDPADELVVTTLTGRQRERQASRVARAPWACRESRASV